MQAGFLDSLFEKIIKSDEIQKRCEPKTYLVNNVLFLNRLLNDIQKEYTKIINYDQENKINRKHNENSILLRRLLLL